MFSGVLGFAFVNYCLFKYFYKLEKRTEFEMQESRIACEPFLLAENDRQLLKTLWINREEERELMKNEPNWVVGTWYGDKVYTDTSKFILPTPIEMYVHSHPKELQKRMEQKLWN